MLSLTFLVLFVVAFVLGILSALNWKKFNEMDKRNFGRRKLAKKAIVYAALAILIIVGVAFVQPTHSCMFSCGAQEILSKEFGAK